MQLREAFGFFHGGSFGWLQAQDDNGIGTSAGIPAASWLTQESRRFGVPQRRSATAYPPNGYDLTNVQKT